MPYSEPPLHPSLQNYKPLRFFEEYLTVGKQVLVLGMTPATEYELWTEEDYENVIEEVGETYKTCRMSVAVICVHLATC